MEINFYFLQIRGSEYQNTLFVLGKFEVADFLQKSPLYSWILEWGCIWSSVCVREPRSFITWWDNKQSPRQNKAFQTRFLVDTMTELHKVFQTWFLVDTVTELQKVFQTRFLVDAACDWIA